MKIINEYRLTKITANYEKHETITAIATVIGAAIAAAAAIGNTISQSETNKANRAQAEALNAKANERDDTQFQRAVADAKAAGLSPLAAISNGGGNTAPIMSTAQAPQMDLSSLIGLGTSMADLSETKRSNKAREDISNKEIEKRTEIAEEQIAAAITQTNMNNDAQMQRLQKQIEQQNKTLQLEDDKLKQEIAEKKSEKTFQTWQEIGKTWGINPKATYTDDWEVYTQKLAIAEEKFAEALKIFQENASPDKSGQNSSTAQSFQTGGSLNIQPGPFMPSVGANANYGENNSNSTGATEDITRKNSAYLAELCKDIEWPIYIYNAK